MKAQKLYLLMLCFTSTCLFSQSITIAEKTEINSLKAFHPVFNAAGDKLLFSSDSYSGLSMLDLKTQGIQQISNAAGAGREPTFSNDGRSVYFYRLSTENKRHVKSLIRYQLNSGKEEVLSTPARGEVLKTKLRSLESPKVVVATEKMKLVLYRDSQQTILDPVNDPAGYIWPSLSPNGKMILFTSMSKGTFVCDLEGTVLASLGNLNAPAWYGDRYVVGMEDKDDGVVMTSSKIVIMSLDGKIKQTLSDAHEIAIYPAASFVSGNIAYSSDKGQLRVLKVEISE
jgi:Tol biopolymer transport system component